MELHAARRAAAARAAQASEKRCNAITFLRTKEGAGKLREGFPRQLLVDVAIRHQIDRSTPQLPEKRPARIDCRAAQFVNEPALSRPSPSARRSRGAGQSSRGCRGKPRVAVPARARRPQAPCLKSGP